MEREGQHRDMVYCHQCENEWYRDEHGLTCPECLSDFTEIIEPDHDPRMERDQGFEEDNQVTFAMPGFFPHPNIYAQHPFPGNVPDPGEGDIEQVQWTSNGPGHAGFSARYSGPGQPRGQGSAGDGGGGGNEPPQNNSMFAMFGNMIQSIAGPDVFRGFQQQSPQQQLAGQPGGGGQGQSGHQEWERGQLPTGPNSNAQPDPHRPQSALGFRPWQEGGAPNVRIVHGRGPAGAFTVTSSWGGGLYPRDANNPQPPNQPVDGLQAMLSQMFGGGGGVVQFQTGGQGQGQGQMPVNPFAMIFNQLFNPAAAASGDAVFTQEAFDRVISQLMEQNTTGNAPGPATQSAINSLPKRRLDLKDLGEEGRAECTICMDEVTVGEDITVLPCEHWFHGECVASWLREHDTCPHCRKGIMPKDGERTVRSPNQEPMHNMDPFSGGAGGPQSPLVPGGMPNEAWRAEQSGTGSRENPLVVPTSPRPAARRYSSGDLTRVRSAGAPAGSSDGGGGAVGIAERVRRAWAGRGTRPGADGDGGPSGT